MIPKPFPFLFPFKLVRIICLTAIFLLIAILILFTGLNLFLATRIGKGVILSELGKYSELGISFRSVNFLPPFVTLSDIIILSPKKPSVRILSKIEKLRANFDILNLYVRSIEANFVEIRLEKNTYSLGEILKINRKIPYHILPKYIILKNVRIYYDETKIDDIVIKCKLDEDGYRIHIDGETLKGEGFLDFNRKTFDFHLERCLSGLKGATGNRM